MALWKDQSTSAPKPNEPVLREDATPEMHEYAPPPAAPNRSSSSDVKESVIGADLSIEGSITGNGSVRLAGRFTGDVTVDGAVTIEPGAKLAGGVRATTVTIAGELEGNVLQAKRVDVLASGALVGDLKAETLTVAAGSRVRGHIECGWAETAATSRSPSDRMSAKTPLSNAKTTQTSDVSNGTEAVSHT